MLYKTANLDWGLCQVGYIHASIHAIGSSRHPCHTYRDGCFHAMESNWLSKTDRSALPTTSYVKNQKDQHSMV